MPFFYSCFVFNLIPGAPQPCEINGNVRKSFLPVNVNHHSYLNDIYTTPGRHHSPRLYSDMNIKRCFYFRSQWQHVRGMYVVYLKRNDNKKSGLRIYIRYIPRLQLILRDNSGQLKKRFCNIKSTTRKVVFLSFTCAILSRDNVVCIIFTCNIINGNESSLYQFYVQHFQQKR